MHDHFEDTIIPSIYNNVSGYESQSSFYKDSKDPLMKDIAYKTETHLQQRNMKKVVF